MTATASLLLVCLSLLTVASLDYCGKSPDSVTWHPRAPVTADRFSIPPLDQAGWNLRQVFVFLRHGDRHVAEAGKCWSKEAETLEKCRTADVSLPSDRLHVSKFWEKAHLTEGEERCAIGQLTSVGYKQHLRNGEILRRTYGNFISDHFDSSEIYVRSTDYSRTMSSAHAVLVGLYNSPRKIELSFNHLLDIDVEKELHGIITLNYNEFPILRNFTHDALHSLDLHIENLASLRRQFQTESEQISNHLRDKFGDRRRFSDDLIPLFDCLNVNYCHNRQIPVEDTFLHLVNRVTPLKYQLILNTPNRTEFGKHAVGPLLSAVQREMHKSLTGQSGAKKLYIIMGHDTGPMMPLLSALGIWDGSWPSYASKLILELYNNKLDEEEFAVRVVYDGKEVTLPGCSNKLCQWTEFESIMQELQPPTKTFSFFL